MGGPSTKSYLLCALLLYHLISSVFPNVQSRTSPPLTSPATSLPTVLQTRSLHSSHAPQPCPGLHVLLLPPCLHTRVCPLAKPPLQSYLLSLLGHHRRWCRPVACCKPLPCLLQTLDAAAANMGRWCCKGLLPPSLLQAPATTAANAGCRCYECRPPLLQGLLPMTACCKRRLPLLQMSDAAAMSAARCCCKLRLPLLRAPPCKLRSPLLQRSAAAATNNGCRCFKGVGRARWPSCMAEAAGDDGSAAVGDG
jgi:hypothetical protein